MASSSKPIVRRVGKFRIQADVLLDNWEMFAEKLFSQVAIVRAECHALGYVEYTAFSRHFIEVPSEKEPPDYMPQLARKPGGGIEFIGFTNLR